MRCKQILTSIIQGKKDLKIHFILLTFFNQYIFPVTFHCQNTCIFKLYVSFYGNIYITATKKSVLQNKQDLLSSS